MLNSNKKIYQGQEKENYRDLISQEYTVSTKKDPLIKMDNYFNFESPNSMKSNSSQENKELDQDKKFILIENKNSVVYTESEWKELIKKNDYSFKLDKLVKSLSYGIPNKLRGKIWVYLAMSFTIALNHDSNIYYKLLETPNEEVETKIRNDVDRSALMKYESKEGVAVTFQLSDQNKQKLFNILKAYAIYDHQVNYCQGTNFILAVLILNITSERCAFWTFVQIMYDKNWRYLCMDKVPKLMRMLDLFAEYLKQRVFEVYSYFDKLGIINLEFKGLFTHYFSTLFCGFVPIEYSIRVIDLFWVYDEKIIFDCLVHLLKLQKEKILKMRLEDLFVFLKSDLVTSCIKEYGLEKSLPILLNFEEREINI